MEAEGATAITKFTLENAVATHGNSNMSFVSNWVQVDDVLKDCAEIYVDCLDLEAQIPQTPEGANVYELMRIMKTRLFLTNQSLRGFVPKMQSMCSELGHRVCQDAVFFRSDTGTPILAANANRQLADMIRGIQTTKETCRMLIGELKQYAGAEDHELVSRHAVEIHDFMTNHLSVAKGWKVDEDQAKRLRAALEDENLKEESKKQADVLGKLVGEHDLLYERVKFLAAYSMENLKEKNVDIQHLANMVKKKNQLQNQYIDAANECRKVKESGPSHCNIREELTTDQVEQGLKCGGTGATRRRKPKREEGGHHREVRPSQKLAQNL